MTPPQQPDIWNVPMPKDLCDRLIKTLVSHEEINIQIEIWDCMEKAIRSRPAPATPDIDIFRGDALQQHDATIAAKAREEVTIDDFCICDLTRYIQESAMMADDVSRCRGKDCNYCGKFNESPRQHEAQQ